MPPCSNSLDIASILQCVINSKVSPHSNNRGCFNIARAMGVLDDDERVHVVAVANDSRQDTTWSQLAHSPLSQPTTANMS